MTSLAESEPPSSPHRRRVGGFVAVLVWCGTALFTASNPAAAQVPAKAYRVGWLGPGAAPSPAERSAGDFQLALKDLGYVEGRNVVIEYRFAGDRTDLLPQLARELAAANVDVIVASGDSAVLAAKRATSAIPVVATEIVTDPVKTQIVASLNRPEANVTGLATLNEELWGKRLDVFRQIVPRLGRAAILWNPANPGNRACVEEIRAAAPTLGVQVQSLEVADTPALERAFGAIVKDRPDALLLCWDSVTLAHARRIADFALKERLPTLAPIREYVDAGSLMSLGISLPAHRRRAAYYVDKVLKGTKPGALPVERAAQFDLVLNLRTAKALGIALPASVQMLADDMVQ